MSTALDRIRKGMDDILTVGEVRDIGKILSNRPGR